MKQENVKIISPDELGDVVPSYAPVDEFKFVDEDIKKEFEGKSYLQGMPTQVQLNRNIQKLYELLSKTNAPTV